MVTTSGYDFEKESFPTELQSDRPFIRKGFVSMVGGGEKVPVIILRDTGVFDSFIQVRVLPFSKESEWI